MRVGINSAQADATDNKSNIPGPLPSRLFIIVVITIAAPVVDTEMRVLKTFIQSIHGNNFPNVGIK